MLSAAKDLPPNSKDLPSYKLRVQEDDVEECIAAFEADDG